MNEQTENILTSDKNYISNLIKFYKAFKSIAANKRMHYEHVAVHDARTRQPCDLRYKRVAEEGQKQS